MVFKKSRDVALHLKVLLLQSQLEAQQRNVLASNGTMFSLKTVLKVLRYSKKFFEEMTCVRSEPSETLEGLSFGIHNDNCWTAGYSRPQISLPSPIGSGVGESPYTAL